MRLLHVPAHLVRKAMALASHGADVLPIQMSFHSSESSKGFSPLCSASCQSRGMVRDCGSCQMAEACLGTRVVAGESVQVLACIVSI